MKHSGKSSLAALAAKALRTSFFDMDDLLKELYRSENGEDLSSRQIYRRGREIFMSWELKAARVLAGREGFFIAAAGGGICENDGACDVLKDFTWVYIDEKAEVLFDRIKRGGIPPFLSAEDPYNDFLRLYRNRTSIYDKLCNIRVQADGRKPDQICAEIIDRLTEAGYGR